MPRNPKTNSDPKELDLPLQNLLILPKPRKHRNFCQLRPWTNEIFDTPALFGARFFSTAPHLRSSSSSSSSAHHRDHDVPAYGSESAATASPENPPSSPAISIDGSPHLEATAASPAAGLDLLRERYRRRSLRDRFNSDFYHRDPLYTREPGPEARFDRSGRRERQLLALFAAAPQGAGEAGRPAVDRPGTSAAGGCGGGISLVGGEGSRRALRAGPARGDGPESARARSP